MEKESNSMVPPHNDEIEAYVLGSLILEPDDIYKVIDILSPEMFYQDNHRIIYQTILDMVTSNKKVDIYTVYSEVIKNPLGKDITAWDVTSLTTKVGSTGNIIQHSQILAEKSIRRSLIKSGHDLISAGYDETIDIETTMSKTSGVVDSITSGIIRKKAEFVGEILPKSIKKIEEAAENGTGISGIPTGFQSIDNVTQGWQNSDLVIIAARPSHGKTAFSMSMAVNMAKLDINVLFFSLEMSKMQLTNRIISMETGIDQSTIRSGRLTDLEWTTLEGSVNKIGNLSLLIDDESAVSTLSMRAKCKNYIQKYGIQVIMVDYLQLMQGSKESKKVREQEIREISNTLKSIAKENNIPVIALAQLNREVEKRADKKPMLSDLKESGSIEQDADIVMFIYRPEKYGIEVTEDGEPTADLGQIIVAKNRNGVTCDVNLKFNGNQVKFEEWI